MLETTYKEIDKLDAKKPNHRKEPRKPPFIPVVFDYGETSYVNITADFYRPFLEKLESDLRRPKL